MRYGCLCKEDHLRWGKGDLQVGQKYLLKSMDICRMTLDRKEGGFGNRVCVCVCVGGSHLLLLLLRNI